MTAADTLNGYTDVLEVCGAIRSRLVDLQEQVKTVEKEP